MEEDSGAEDGSWLAGSEDCAVSEETAAEETAAEEAPFSEEQAHAAAARQRQRKRERNRFNMMTDLLSGNFI